jgi:hypothetical protein
MNVARSHRQSVYIRMICSPEIRDLEPSVSSTKKKWVAPRRDVPTGAPSPLFA